VLLSLKELTNLFKALSDATRLRVVNLLRTQSLCVGDLQVVLGLSQPTVSRQLAILRAAELVRAERQGTRICYSLARAPFLNYPLDRFLSEIVPFFPELAADIQKLVDFKGDSVSHSPHDGERAGSGQA
jgi:ArsR family transcriptional regulator